MAKQIDVIINGERYVPVSSKLFEGAGDDAAKLGLQFVASLTLCDHMGDVAEEIDDFLKRLGVGVPVWYKMIELMNELGRMGVTTMSGVSLIKEQYDEEE